jgi:branched-chain amino acid transport system ATP-binding protein
MVLKAEGVAVVLVEQRVEAVLKMADRVAFMTGGRITESMQVNGLRPDAEVFRTYVGV